MKFDSQKKLFLILLFAFLTRLAIFLNPQPYLAYDEKDYFETGTGLRKDLGRPVFLLFLAKIIPNLLLLKFVVVGFGIFSVYMMYVLGKELFDEKIGLISSFVLACNPLHIILSTMFLTDVPFFAFVLVTLYAMLKDDSKLLLFGLIFSLLTRYEAILLVPVLFLHWWENKKISKWNILAVVIFSMAVLILFPRMIMIGKINALKETSKFYLYLITPFLINGFLILNFFVKLRQTTNHKFLLALFLIFVAFYMVTSTGLNMSDKFRYMFPTLIPSTLIIGKYTHSKRMIVLLCLLNVIFGLVLGLKYSEVKQILLSLKFFGAH